MKTTIEEINGVQHTFITVDDADEWEYLESDRIQDWQGVYIFMQGKYLHPLPAGAYVIGYALPPVPRSPMLSDAWLLHLYAAHGLGVMCGLLPALGALGTGEVTHAINAQRELVEIAIVEDREHI